MVNAPHQIPKSFSHYRPIQFVNFVLADIGGYSRIASLSESVREPAVYGCSVVDDLPFTTMTVDAHDGGTESIVLLWRSEDQPDTPVTGAVELDLLKQVTLLLLCRNNYRIQGDLLSR